MAETQQKAALDKFGREFKVGDIIAYGSLLGRCASIRIGKVLKLTQKPHSWRDEELNWHVQVIGVDDTSWDSKDEPKLCASKGTLTEIGRAMILSRDAVPAKYLDMLDPITADTKLAKPRY